MASHWHPRKFSSAPHNDLFTFLSNKDGHGRRGTLIAAVKGTTVAEVSMRLMAIPAEIVIDCFHIMQLAGKGLEETRMKLKRAAVTERKKQEAEFKNKQQKRNKNRTRYAKTHKPTYGKSGKRLGRPRKCKNEKFTPEILSNGETKVEMLTHVRYPLLKSGNDWTDWQKKGMKILFELDTRIKNGYGLVCALRNIFKKKQSREKSRKTLQAWYKNVGRSRIREHIAVRDTIKSKEEYVLNYFNNRSTNASAESLNSKVKGFRAQVRGVADLPFIMYRMMNIFG